MSKLDDVFDILDKLQERQIYFTLAYHTPRALMILVAVPGEKWEIEIGSDEEIQVEVFTSRGGVEGLSTLNELFERFSD